MIEAFNTKTEVNMSKCDMTKSCYNGNAIDKFFTILIFAFIVCFKIRFRGLTTKRQMVLIVSTRCQIGNCANTKYAIYVTQLHSSWGGHRPNWGKLALNL